MPSLAPLSPLASLRWALVDPLVAAAGGGDILEIGCGQGGIGSRLAARGRYLGLEPDASSCEVARARIEPLGGRVRCATLDALDPGLRFDVVCAFEVLEHLEDDGAALGEWVKRLRPGGTLIVTAPAWPERFGAWDAAVGHFRRYTPEQLGLLLEAAGLAETAEVVYGWPLGDVLEKGRNLLAGRARAGSSTAARTAASGRQLQPGRWSGPAIRAGITPFVRLQSMRPDRGPALLGHGRRAGGARDR